jgi:hypothetical protein
MTPHQRLVSGLVFFSSLLLFLMAGLPAVLFKGLLPQEAQSAQISGSLWSGEARQLHLGDRQLELVRWSLSPLRVTLEGRLNTNNTFQTQLSWYKVWKGFELSEGQFALDGYGINQLVQSIPLPFAFKSHCQVGEISANYGMIQLLGLDLGCQIKQLSLGRDFFGDYRLACHEKEAAFSCQLTSEKSAKLSVDLEITSQDLKTIRLQGQAEGHTPATREWLKTLGITSSQINMTRRL